MKNILLLLLTLSLLLANNSFAQISPNLDIGNYQQILDTNVSPDIKEQISVSVSPSTPRPNEVVTLSIKSFSADLDRAKISWYVNGSLVISQIGAKQFQFTNGTLGKTTQVKFFIEKIEGGTISETRSFTPAEVDLVYQAETYSHPFYDGKSLYTAQSQATVVAIPQFKTSQGNFIDPNTLVYEWYEDGSYVQSVSGYGKQAFPYEGKVISRAVKVGLLVSDLNGNLSAESSLILSPNTPTVSVYEKNPLLGTIFEKEIRGSFFLERPEIEFEAVPFFFNNDDTYLNQNKYTWLLNGNQVNSPNQNSIVFRNENNQTGQANIELRVKNSTLLQNASTDFTLLFGEILNDFSF